MYDKIRMVIGRGSGCADVTQYLDNAKEQTNLKTGEVCAFGGYHGMRVDVYAGYVYITGSLAKLVYGNNFYTLDRETTAKAVASLEDGLHMDLRNAKVTELEFGRNFAMSRPVVEYLQRLGDIPRMVRSEVGVSTLYYMGKGKTKPLVVTFYDKKAEALAKGVALPAGYDGVNLLRYEIRYKGRLPYQLGVPAVTASTLYEREFCGMMARRYVGRYLTIKKINFEGVYDMKRVNNVRDACKMFVAQAMVEGWESRVEPFVGKLKEMQVFKHESEYTRLRHKIKDIAAMRCDANNDGLVKELDEKIMSVSTLWA